MEDIVSKFSDVLVATKDRASNYKSRGKSTNQLKRRTLMLESQQQKRCANQDLSRGIFDLVQEAALEDASPKVYKPKVEVAGFTKKIRYFSDTLMLSEWMADIPEDLSEKWLAVICPKGYRTLVVAHGGITKAFNKTGKFIQRWPSILAGGCNSNFHSKNSTVLDCIWNEATKSFYVLDVLAWGRQSFIDCDVDFREFWLRTQFSECPEFGEVSKKNKFPMYALPKYKCTRDYLGSFLSTWPAFPCNNPPVDGLLFYHRDSHYVSGSTPLVTWLYPYMVNEVFGSDIGVHLEYMKEKPTNYTNQDVFIQTYDAITSKKQFCQVYERRRVHSFSSFGSNSSFDSSNNSDHSFGSGIVQMLFSADRVKKPAEDRKEFLDNLQKNIKRVQILQNKNSKKRKIKMDALQNSSIEADSAVSSMEDSVTEDCQ